MKTLIAVLALIAVTALTTHHFTKDRTMAAFPSSLLREQPNSPVVTTSDDFIVVTRRYMMEGRQSKTDLVAKGFAPKDDYIDPEYDAKFQSLTFESTQSYPVIVVTFRKRKTPPAKYTCHNYSFERPLEQHADYLTNWNYGLYAQSGTTATPAYWATATDLTDTEGQAVYRWSKTNPGSGWPNMIKASTKPGVNGYLFEGARITKRKVYKDNTAAQASRWSGEVGSTCLPDEVFNLTNERDYWLISDVRVVEDQGAYATTVEFLYSGGQASWDTDIYDFSIKFDDGE
jgi:hypothetical protein